MPAEAIAIAIDGPASSGKGTVARLVAEALGFSYVDTGAMYRCVALAAARLGVPWSEGPALAALIPSLHFELRFEAGRLAVRVNGEDVSEAIRAETISLGASAVATLPEVRTALLEGQRALARRGGVVMDGRDIGTVVLPDAALKVYLDADVDERARRRQAELAARGQASPSRPYATTCAPATPETCSGRRRRYAKQKTPCFWTPRGAPPSSSPKRSSGSPKPAALDGIQAQG